MMPPPTPAIFTELEIEKMRLYVTEHDKSRAVNIFDLNAPPRTPYTHQEFPKLVYSLDAANKPIMKPVEDAEAHAKAIAGGWFNTPQVAAEPEAIELDAASAAEASAFDKRLIEARKQKAAQLAKAAR
jgi:hypothetical protein